jgi:branched-chain amino acid transport system substrate-binding protein
MRLRVALILAAALWPFAMVGASNAQDRPVKIGVLNDQASVYAGITGPGSVAAAKLAIEDMGGSMFGKPIELVFAPTMRTSPISAPRSPANGSTRRVWMRFSTSTVPA